MAPYFQALGGTDPPADSFTVVETYERAVLCADAFSNVNSVLGAQSGADALTLPATNPSTNAGAFRGAESCTFDGAYVSPIPAPNPLPHFLADYHFDTDDFALPDARSFTRPDEVALVTAESHAFRHPYDRPDSIPLGST